MDRLEGQGALQSVGQSMADFDNSAVEFDFQELMFRLLSSWKMVVCLILVFMVGALVVTEYFITPMYQATATIYVLSRRDSAINISDIQLGTSLTADYIKVFKMWEVHEEVISSLNLPYSYSQARKMLSVTNDSGTRMLDIKVTSADPKEAAAMANEYARVASNYIAETMAMDKPNIMSVALEPKNPSSPSRTRNVVIGFLLGAVLGFGIVFIGMLVDDKIKTAADIRRYIGIENLAIVPVQENFGNNANVSRGKSKR